MPVGLDGTSARAVDSFFVVGGSSVPAVPVTGAGALGNAPPVGGGKVGATGTAATMVAHILVVFYPPHSSHQGSSFIIRVY